MEIYEKIILPTLLGFGGIVTLIWAVYVFYQQQKFKRIQNLSSVWQKFIDSEQLMTLFTLCDDIIDNSDSKDKEQKQRELYNFSDTQKLRFLGLLEEVAIYTEMSEIDKEYALYLFQWHYYFVFGGETSIDFWGNIGGKEESQKAYWSKSRNLSPKSKPI